MQRLWRGHPGPHQSRQRPVAYRRWPVLRSQSPRRPAVLPTHRSPLTLLRYTRHGDQPRGRRRQFCRVTRMGLIGGTFDPPHYGHLLAAQEAAWQLDLERVLFLPARQNPLKEGEPSSSEVDRCEMVARAIGGNQRFELSRLEMDRPPPSYTADLLRALEAPERELFFLVGADILPDLHR